ncbi:MAG: DNA polymerase III subunit chi [Janthinobacterium lividum]
MTRVDFHTHIADRLGYACRLVRKAYLADQPVIVFGAPEQLRAFDSLLWTFSPLEFVPHCMSGSATVADTPIVLTSDCDSAPHQNVLLNLGDAVPPSFARFQRLLELVGDTPDALHSGRDRYRFYRDRGYPLNSFRQGQAPTAEAP